MSHLDDCSIDDLRELEWRKLEADLGNHMYQAALIFERLEHAGRIYGNGHHIAQELAERAKTILNNRRKPAS